MHKAILVAIILGLLPSSTLAEVWKCSYEYNNEVRSSVYERRGTSFYKVGTDDFLTIIYESDAAIFLVARGDQRGDASFESFNVRLFDKTYNKFQATGLGSNGWKTAHVVGNCQVE